MRATVLRLIPARLVERPRAAREGGDEGVAILLVIMLMLVVTSLSLLVLGVVLAQVQPTALAQKSTVTFNGAQAGVDAALSQIRTSVSAPATNGKVYGNPATLPCAVQGSVGAGADQTGYSVTVEYYDADPTGLVGAERTKHRLACTAGGGVAVVPAYALITSAGSAPGRSVPRAGSGSGNRSIQSLYTFEVTNTNVPGGIFYTLSGAFCLTADSKAVGALVKYTAATNCSSSNPLQNWVYDTDYEIKLADSLTGQPLCLTLASQTERRDVTLQPCKVQQTSQLLSYEGGAHFRAQNSDNTDYGSLCLFAGRTSTPVEGDHLQAGSEGCSSNSDWGSFKPQPKVGAGAASKKTDQIVNYLEFGRCMDVTLEDVNYRYMMVYPCKQDPSTTGGKLKWNHRFYYTEGTETSPTTAGQHITVKVDNDPSRTYCMTTPPAGGSSVYVTFVSVCNDSDTRQTFTRTWKVADDYAASYTFKDSLGRCLSLGPDGGQGFSTIVLATCTGGSEQKWNAPAGLQDAGVSGTRETTYDKPSGP